MASLENEDVLADRLLKVVDALPPKDYEAAKPLERVIDEQVALIADESIGLATDEVLDALAAIAATSPIANIDDPGAALRTGGIVENTVCLHAINALEEMSIIPGKAAGVAARLEVLLSDSADYHVRNEALQRLKYRGKRVRDTFVFAFDALERQAQFNDCPSIRMRCREALLEIAVVHPEMTDRARAAYVAGAKDSDRTARSNALAMLFGRLEICPADEAESLMKVFSSAAEADDIVTKDWGKDGLACFNERGLKDMVERGCATRENIPVLKPLRFRQPGL